MKESMEQFLQRVSKIEFTYIIREMCETFFTLEFKEKGIKSKVNIMGIVEANEELDFSKELENKILEYLIKTNMKNWKEEYLLDDSEEILDKKFEWKLVVTFKDNSTKKSYGINNSPRKMIHMTKISMAIQMLAMEKSKKTHYRENPDGSLTFIG